MDFIQDLKNPPAVSRPGRVDEIRELVKDDHGEEVLQALDSALASRAWSAGSLRGVLKKRGYDVAESTLRVWRKDRYGI